MKAYLACLAAVVVLFSANVAQSETGGRWWRIPRLVERLNLTPSQIERLDKAFHRVRLNMIRLKGKVETEQFELEFLMEADNFSEQAAMDQYRKLEAARIALGTERFRFLVQVRKVLGPETFRKLMQIKRERARNVKKGKPGPGR